jgi:acyl carrier protein
MTPEEIIDKINSIMVNDFEIEPSRLKPEAALKADLGLDSLDGVDLVVAVEREFHICIEEEEARSMTRMRDIYDYITKHS